MHSTPPSDSFGSRPAGTESHAFVVALGSGKQEPRTSDQRACRWRRKRARYLESPASGCRSSSGSRTATTTGIGIIALPARAVELEPVTLLPP
jgi:hypothetical protein